MFYNLTLVGLGGAAGSVLRYFFQRCLNVKFPYGTLIVNITGCLLIGLLMGYFGKQSEESKKLLLITGFCGGFTTFSSFSWEATQLIHDNRWFAFLFYISISVIAGLMATIIGLKLANNSL
ncbi:MAG: fluoride efflux transporter CrcB [Flavisolibacter sp.]